ncbi:MAG: hypothetical protein V2J20_08535 [Wenzhouxiangella sp.]|jgi:hypothetical protein|nr:hypothetical protein [Wenzhouxiangella sp.]
MLIKFGRWAIGMVAGAALLLVLSGCGSGTESEAENHELRVYDVSHLQAEEFSEELAFLLSRESLPLHGSVTLIDETTMAVNGPKELQSQIARLLNELGQAPTAEERFQREYRLQFWLLALSPKADNQPLPAPLEPAAEAMGELFPDYGVRVIEAIETSGNLSITQARRVLLNSGSGSAYNIWSLDLHENGGKLLAQIHTRTEAPFRGTAQFQVSRNLSVGQPLVLGRAGASAEDGQLHYQVLVARMDWID